MITPGNNEPSDVRTALADVMAFIHARGWAPGTGGNFSCLVERSPLRLLMSPSGVDKGAVCPADLIMVDEDARLVSGCGKPSAESLLHVEIARRTSAGSVLHTHSIWSTVLSRRYLERGELRLSGFEMLKGLSGIETHDCSLRVPILENSQDIPALARRAGEMLGSDPSLRGFLLSGHGLYTWGENVYTAKRHVEVLEFLFEAHGTELLLERSSR